jgi:hypothetical protein
LRPCTLAFLNATCLKSKSVSPKIFFCNKYPEFFQYYYQQCCPSDRLLCSYRRAGNIICATTVLCQVPAGWAESLPKTAPNFPGL